MWWDDEEDGQRVSVLDGEREPTWLRRSQFNCWENHKTNHEDVLGMTIMMRIWWMQRSVSSGVQSTDSLFLYTPFLLLQQCYIFNIVDYDDGLNFFCCIFFTVTVYPLPIFLLLRYVYWPIKWTWRDEERYVRHLMLLLVLLSWYELHDDDFW